MDKIKQRRIVQRWALLTDEEKAETWRKWNVIAQFLEQHPNQQLSWKTVDKYLPHVYTFMIRRYNKDYGGVKGYIDWNDDGIILLSNEPDWFVGEN